MSNPVINAAMTRAAMIGLLLGVLAFIGARQQGIDWEQAIYGGVGAFVASVLSRGFGEGLYDSNRAAATRPPRWMISPEHRPFCRIRPLSCYCRRRPS